MGVGVAEGRGGISISEGFEAGLVDGGTVSLRRVAMRITKAMAPPIMSIPNAVEMVTERDVAMHAHASDGADTGRRTDTISGSFFL